jgi:hypothetical protein
MTTETITLMEQDEAAFLQSWSLQDAITWLPKDSLFIQFIEVETWKPKSPSLWHHAQFVFGRYGFKIVVRIPHNLMQVVVFSFQTNISSRHPSQTTPVYP